MTRFTTTFSSDAVAGNDNEEEDRHETNDNQNNHNDISVLKIMMTMMIKSMTESKSLLKMISIKSMLTIMFCGK